MDTEEIKTKIRAFLNANLDAAKMTLKRDRQFPAFGFLIMYYPKDNKMGFISMPHVHRFFESVKTKALLPEYIKGCCDIAMSLAVQTNNIAECVAVIVVSDAWYIIRRQEQFAKINEQGFAPSEQIDRKEAIMAMVHMKEGSFNYWCPYTNTDGIIAFDKDIETPAASGGNFENLFPKQTGKAEV